MKKLLSIIAIVSGVFLTNCTNINRSMREPNTRLNLEKKDFTLSDQVTGEATSTKILGIDFKRLLLKESGIHNNDNIVPSLPINFASIPVIGGFIMDQTAGYALYDMMKNNPGYDVVF